MAVDKKKKKTRKTRGKPVSKVKDDKAQAKKKNDKLTAQQEVFCQAYAVHHTGTKAAIRAKYSKKAAAAIASRLLTIAKIKERIKKIEAKSLKKYEVSRESIIAEYAKLGYSNLSDIIDLSSGKPVLRPIEEIRPEALASISEIGTDSKGRIKIKLHSKPSSLEALAKINSMFKEIHEHSGPEGAPIEHNFTVEFVKTKKRKKSG
jgi:phage terminase small subunit